MPIEVEANLRIPSLTVRSAVEPERVINNSSVRYTTLIQVPVIPKPGTPPQLKTSAGHLLDATVTRADWSEDRAMFIVSCTYAKRSIPLDEYNALVNDEAWGVKQLPA